jgi:hypothetical protein
LSFWAPRVLWASRAGVQNLCLRIFILSCAGDKSGVLLSRDAPLPVGRPTTAIETHYPQPGGWGLKAAAAKAAASFLCGPRLLKLHVLYINHKNNPSLQVS